MEAAISNISSPDTTTIPLPEPTNTAQPAAGPGRAYRGCNKQFDQETDLTCTLKRAIDTPGGIDRFN